MSQTDSRPRFAATLLELLLTTGMMSILISLLLVAIQHLRETAAFCGCKSHLKQLMLAVHSHHDVKGTMPPYASGRPREIFGGWFMHLLPFVDEGNLYEQLTARQNTVSPTGVKVASTGGELEEARNAVFPLLTCASDPKRPGGYADNTTNYLASWYGLSDGIRGTYRPAQRLASLTDGLSHVVLFAEGYSRCKDLPRLALYSAHYHNFGITQEGLPSDDSWYEPKNYLLFQMSPEECDPWRTQTAHKNMPTAWADGSVRTVRADVSLETWTQLLRARDGAVPASDW